MREGGFFDLFTGYGMQLARARRYMEPRLADAFESQELELRPGTPVLVVDRYTYGPGEGPVLVRCVWTVRGDRCRHYINTETSI
ncbi:MAG: UTRA domain protein [Firmicutes bacterium ADurb.BinA052]|nr:MAG: UTRA domain protein [Firmicutes bacterium ADurb.BinA052]